MDDLKTRHFRPFENQTVKLSRIQINTVFKCPVFGWLLYTTKYNSLLSTISTPAAPSLKNLPWPFSSFPLPPVFLSPHPSWPPSRDSLARVSSGNPERTERTNRQTRKSDPELSR